MSAQTSMYLRQYVMEHVLMRANHDSPDNLYLALFLEDPTPYGTGTEVSGDGYARQEVAWEFTDRVDEAMNSAMLNFPAALEDWGTVTHWGVYDSVTGGNLLYFAEAKLPRVTETGDLNVVPAGSVTIDASGETA